MSPRAHGRLMMEDFDAPHTDATDAAPVCSCARCARDPRHLRCLSELHEEGVREGAALARTADDARLDGITSRLTAALAGSATEAAAIAEDTAASIGEAVIAMVLALFPASLAGLGAREAGAIAAAVLPSLAHAPAVTIDIAPAARADIDAALQRLPVDQRARVDIRTHAAMADGDLAILWSGGALRHDGAKAMAGVRDVLAGLGLLAPDHAHPKNPKELVHG